jgi:transcription-repair coupling factor (superfamily II helicase)
LLSELADRYGPVPESLTHLVAFSQLKTLAAKTGIEAIDRRGGGVNIKFHPGAAIDPNKLMTLISTQSGVQFTPEGVLRVPVPQVGAGDLLLLLQQQIEALRN